MFSDTYGRLRVSISGIGSVTDLSQVSRLAFNVQAIETPDPDSDFVLFRPGPISVDRFRFSIARFPGADIANLSHILSWWGTVQKGTADARTITVELLAGDGATRGLHVELEDSVPVAYDPVSQTMTVQPGRVVLRKLFKPKSGDVFATLNGPTSLSFNTRMTIANEPFSPYDVTGGGTEFEIVTTTVGTDGQSTHTLGRRRVQPMTVLTSLPPALTMIEDWIQAVLASGNPDRNVALQQFNDNGTPGPMVFSIYDAFPTRVVLLDSSFVTSDGQVALAVRITAQADGSQ
jgi:hypothetical protein